MNIPVSIEIDNSFSENIFLDGYAEQLEQTIFRTVLDIGCKIYCEMIESIDSAICRERDMARYRNKGLRSTCIKTVMGGVTYRRHVYQDRQDNRCVCLLDETLKIDTVGLMSHNFVLMAAEAVCSCSYRDAALLLSQTTGLPVSHQALWDVVQQLGIQQKTVIARNQELANLGEGLGTVGTPLLYEEDDGVWLKMQGESRTGNEKGKEMKVGIAYDGVLWQETKDGRRRRLDNKVAYASFETASEFKKSKEGAVAGYYDVSSIELRIHNGDGAAWVQGKDDGGNLYVLDEYHRNDRIDRCVSDRGLARELRSLLYACDIDGLFKAIRKGIQHAGGEDERAKLQELLDYYTNNRDALLGPYERGIDIPPTRLPSVVHHSRLGVMESNIFTLIGNRMKGGRECWSVEGAESLALLLCRKYTIGFGGLLEGPVPLPEPPEPEEWERAPQLSAAKVPESVGKGYKFAYDMTTDSLTNWSQGFIRRLNRI